MRILNRQTKASFQLLWPVQRRRLKSQMAIERSQPESIMCGWDKVKDACSCGNDSLLNDVLKGLAFGLITETGKQGI